VWRSWERCFPCTYYTAFPSENQAGKPPVAVRLTALLSACFSEGTRSYKGTMRLSGRKAWLVPRKVRGSGLHVIYEALAGHVQGACGPWGMLRQAGMPKGKFKAFACLGACYARQGCLSGKANVIRRASCECLGELHSFVQRAKEPERVVTCGSQGVSLRGIHWSPFHSASFHALQANSKSSSSDIPIGSSNK
jgi:hypothetical protein